MYHDIHMLNKSKDYDKKDNYFETVLRAFGKFVMIRDGADRKPNCRRALIDDQC